mmetsp:Transcript_7323/g.10920  ORF Transcript_7323/g.10920 Transcript_7323/m.10920 type:complete len:84 (-) Transcript_7323:124-375(-)
MFLKSIVLFVLSVVTIASSTQKELDSFEHLQRYRSDRNIRVSKNAYLEDRSCRRLHDTSKHLDRSWHPVIEGFYSAEISAVFC